jgi:hypothetical protein
MKNKPTNCEGMYRVQGGGPNVVKHSRLEDA